MLVRNGLQARQVKLDSPLEAVRIEVEIKGNRHRFISLYIPPSRFFSEEEIKGLLVGPRKVISMQRILAGGIDGQIGEAMC